MKKTFLILVLLVLAHPAMAQDALDCYAAAKDEVATAACLKTEYETIKKDLAEAETRALEAAKQIDAEDPQYAVEKKLLQSRSDFDTYAKSQCAYAQATFTNGTLAAQAHKFCEVELMKNHINQIRLN